jgi:superfamily I DNA/RNA helicase/RecB family exonuclease
VTTTASPYRLVRTALPPARRPVPDAAQQRVLDHTRGPLLVLAGPGTGKTTTLVEAVARRVEAGLDPAAVCVLTFSRKAAQELRERITTRLGAAVAGPAAWTFHAWCYALLREWQPADGYLEPVRLLSGPEQDVRLRELLTGSREDGFPRWPADLVACLGTRGFAEEVRALLARAREVGVDPAALAEIAHREGRADWAALADFYGVYLDVLDAEGALDYAELVHRAAALAGRPDVAAHLRTRYRAVFVDEYQDTDPAQERLLSALAGGGGDLIVVGDPDQAIYAFRGAEVSGLLDFPSRFPKVNRRPADVVALTAARRFGPQITEVSRRVAARIPAPGLPAKHLRAHRALVPSGEPDPDERVEVCFYPSVGAEAAAIADLLRREHLECGTRWDRMAVLVRSGARSIPPLRRFLSAAGVPVEVAGDELPLARDPAVAPLLVALRCADDPAKELDAQSARLLLTSPLGGADAARLRALGRALRAADRDARASDPAASSRLPAASAELVREAVADPARVLLPIEDHLGEPARHVGKLLATARRVLRSGGAPQDALWELWTGSSWPARLERASAGGGPAGRAADRDLDAVVALFAAIGRASDRRGRVARVGPLLDELEAQQIPGDTLAERATRPGAVRLLTAHRSKGLEWDVVVVAGVQEGGWPDLRRRNSLLESERLDSPAAGGVREPMTRTELLVDERRLFYVALTRARRRLVVTAVESTDDDGERPSRFVDEMGVAAVRVRSRPARPLNLPALVAALRRAVVDPAASPALRRAAATRLARLAAERDDAGRPLVRTAHPDRWWGLLDSTEGETPVADPAAPIPLSGSSLSGIATCPLRWFLEHEAYASSATSTDMGFGKVVHALADEVATGRTPAEAAALDARLDVVWQHLAYESRWRSDQQREAARDALARFLRWHAAERGRRLVATEVPFTGEIAVGDRTVKLRGFVDRVEIDEDGRVRIVDFKTGRNKAPRIGEHPQLGSYQLAVAAGALDEAVRGGGGPAGAPPGGAELVNLRRDAGTDSAGPAQPGDAPRAPEVQEQPALVASGDGPTWIENLLSSAVHRIDTESFPPTPGDACGPCAFRRACPAQDEGRQVIT